MLIGVLSPPSRVFHELLHIQLVFQASLLSCPKLFAVALKSQHQTKLLEGL